MKNRNIPHSDNWATPPAFYAELDKEFNFDFDPCPLNHDVTEWDGLTVEWGSSTFCNPPYSRALKPLFVKKAVAEAKKGKTVVLLLPVSTSTALFHDWIKPNAKEIRFVRGRIRFQGINTKGEYVTDKAPMHDSMVVVLGCGGDSDGKVWEVSGMKAEYDALLKTGMFFEFYPDLIGEWEKDKEQWRKIYRKLKKSRR